MKFPKQKDVGRTQSGARARAVERSTVGRLLKARRKEILRIAASHGAGNVRIFGSLTRGEGGPSSDLDVLVKLSPNRTLLDIVAIKQDLEDLLGFKVDVVTEGSISPYIREEVLKNAVSL